MAVGASLYIEHVVCHSEHSMDWTILLVVSLTSVLVPSPFTWSVTPTNDLLNSNLPDSIGGLSSAPTES